MVLVPVHYAALRIHPWVGHALWHFGQHHIAHKTHLLQLFGGLGRGEHHIPPLNRVHLGDVELFENALVYVLIGEYLVAKLHLIWVVGFLAIHICLQGPYLQRITCYTYTAFYVVGLQVGRELVVGRVVENHHIIILHMRKTRQPILWQLYGC